MHAPPSRSLALACLTLMLGACDASPPSAPPTEDHGSLVAAEARLSAPAGLAAAAQGPTWIALSWQDVATRESGYEVHRSSTGETGAYALIATTGENATRADDGGATPDTRHCYKVRAFRRTPGKTSYAEFSDVACARTPLPSPWLVDAIPASSSSVSITWRDQSATESGFRLERGGSVDGPWTDVLATAANVTSHVDIGRAAEQAVCYRVVAFNANGASAPSNADCTAPPAAPSGLEATVVGTTIELTWNDNSTVEDGFVVERAHDDQGFSVRGDLIPNSSDFVDGYTWLNTTFSYRVRARRNGGFSDPSETVTAVRSCTPAELGEVCDNGIDDDCDETADWQDTDCGAIPCDWGCPSGYACYPDGFCYPFGSDGASDPCADSSCESPGGQP